ncbi:precorrin-3B synthase [Nocardioides speluncae]|uniref:precorrin-3B synthase n=1 Tax=Nocardioides speluncae TaxID=2670337 RepID=UPI000D688484|nr:precorrin-3B synthase [Nocardioides speluncae]
MPTTRTATDRCPGALRLHAADDGHVARIRVPGGRVTAPQLLALCDAADALGDGVLHLTSRGNVQVRGLAADAGEDVATRLVAAGLLPSLAHDRVRNVVASPYADLDGVLADFDRALVADPGLVELSGRFLFGIDDGSGDVLALRPDLAVTAGSDGPDRWRLVVDGHPTELVGDAVTLLITAAHRFLDLRAQHAPEAWRVRELGTAAAHLGERHAKRLLSLPTRMTSNPATAIVPLGAPTKAWRALAGLAPQLVLTPWRTVVVVADPAAVRAAGFDTDPDSVWARTSACIGRPGCASALADVRRDAAELATAHPGRTIHISGCARRCGHPVAAHLDVVATDAGYQIQERPDGV